MRSRNLAILAVALVICGTILLISRIKKTVTIIIDGEASTFPTTAFTVGGALRRLQIPLTDHDISSQTNEHQLRDGEIIVIERASQVHIQVGGEHHLIFSVERQPANLLSLAGITLYPGDQILANGMSTVPDEILPRIPTQSIQVRRAVPITMTIGTDRQTVYSAASTLGQALWQKGFRLFARDELVPGLDTLLDEPREANVQLSQAVEISIGNHMIQERTSASSVGEALLEAGLPLQGLDYSIPPEYASLPSDGQLRVVSVNEEVVTETTSIPFDTQYQPDPDLEIDNQDVIQAGETGLTVQSHHIRYEDGIEVSRTIDTQYIAKKPQPFVIGYGTKIEPKTISTIGGTIQYWRALEMYAVSYNPTSAGGNITATGLPLKKGVVAIDPSYIPYGTRLFIPGYGEAVAADTGPDLNPRMIDLGYSDEDYVTWHQDITVYFLWPPPENIVWIIP